MTDPVPETAIVAGCGDQEIATRSMRAIGTTATVAVTAADRADEAMTLLADDLRSIDAACSRFRSNSELRQLEVSSGGRPVAVSPLLFDALETARAVAVQTAGIVDPTIGSALIELGYDRDFDDIAAGDLPPDFRAEPAPGWWLIELNPADRTVAIPAGVHVDLGATAKAFAADRAAQRIAAVLGCGALVNLGGDVAVAGHCPRDGWAIGIAPESTSALREVDQVVTLARGGLATSGTTARTWVRNGRTVHHIVDPWTGDVAPAVWSLVSTTAPSCVQANAWSTAAIVWGLDAIGNLAAVGIPARLVRADGNIVHLGGWPLDGTGNNDPGDAELPNSLLDTGTER
ncbi:MAG TPA: FAD:protein FMN transferase [Acidimicrobiales bacterium]|jgi:thiamine biosynthesis lipoprotein|nr:FAD:protein FMN transferase [Acidimicrobiales bacterium]